jgi:phage antirepressor YoqD-like protein
MFEQRILCHKLPNSFNSITINLDQEQYVNKRNKMVQDLKRQMLNIELEQYESKIQHYEQLYEQELSIFQSEICKAESSYQIYHLNELMYLVKIYVYHHTELLLRQIRYKESCFRFKLLRHRPRLANNTIDVYPQIIIDVPKVSLNQSELDYLSRTGR